MAKKTKESDHGVSSPERQAHVTPTKKPTGEAKSVRKPSRPRPVAEPEPRLMALQQTSHGRELIWERDSVLDTYFDSKPRSKPVQQPMSWTAEQEELSQWIAEHGEELPDELTLWPHVKVQKRTFLRSVRERIQNSRRHPEMNANDLWRLLRRVQVVMTAENCVRSI
jgi:hypothetical protein